MSEEFTLPAAIYGEGFVGMPRLELDELRQERDIIRDNNDALAEENKRLRGQLAEAREVISRASSVMHGNGVDDQGDAYHQALNILDGDIFAWVSCHICDDSGWVESTDNRGNQIVKPCGHGDYSSLEIADGYSDDDLASLAVSSEPPQ